MELIVLLMSDNETAVSGALEKFQVNPLTMAYSLNNLRAVLKCLTEDEIIVDVNPLDLYRLAYLEYRNTTWLQLADICRQYNTRKDSKYLYLSDII